MMGIVSETWNLRVLLLLSPTVEFDVQSAGESRRSRGSESEWVHSLTTFCQPALLTSTCYQRTCLPLSYQKVNFSPKLVYLKATSPPS